MTDNIETEAAAAEMRKSPGGPFGVNHPEWYLLDELQATVTGKPLPSQVYKKGVAPGQTLAGHLAGGTSGNWWFDAFGTGYYRKEVGLRERILEFCKASRSCWMGGELLSIIYGPWGHLLPMAAIYTAAVRDGDTEVAAAALEWMQMWFAMTEECLAPDGSTVLTVGGRSGGHYQADTSLPIPNAVWVCYCLAVGWNDVTRQREWLAKAKRVGEAPMHDPVKIMCDALRPALIAGGDAAKAHGAPAYRMATPLHIVKNAQGRANAVWIELSVSGLTPSLMAAAWSKQGAPIYLPERGGSHIRSDADHATCTKSAGLLTYTSSFGGQELQTMAFSPGVEVVRGVVEI